MNKKQSGGITLIALVVSIIVLLILAGISISMLTGQNGILNRAQEAKEKTENATKEETEKITSMEAMIQPAGTAVSNPTSYGANPNAQATADGTGKYFALPTGARYINGTVNTGVVINIKGSEFVWVPVEDVVLDKNRVSDLPISADTGTSNGKTYTPMTVKVGNNYKGILYDYNGSNCYLKYAGNENYLGSTEDYREPDVVSEYDGGEKDTVQGKITIDKLTKEYNEMIESVLKYKGFYVARYEAGLDKTTSEIVFKNASIEDNNVITADANNSETNSWYGLYKKMKTFMTTDDKMVSGMIWGSQYDAMMNWMAKNGNEVGINDGNMYNNTKITGNKNKDLINNVYDLRGCHYEWTLEANETGNRVLRGGYSDYSVSPAGRSVYGPDTAYSGESTRATLYIK